MNCIEATEHDPILLKPFFFTTSSMLYSQVSSPQNYGQLYVTTALNCDHQKDKHRWQKLNSASLDLKCCTTQQERRTWLYCLLALSLKTHCSQPQVLIFFFFNAIRHNAAYQFSKVINITSQQSCQ